MSQSGIDDFGDDDNGDDNGDDDDGPPPEDEYIRVIMHFGRTTDTEGQVSRIEIEAWKIIPADGDVDAASDEVRAEFNRVWDATARNLRGPLLGFGNKKEANLSEQFIGEGDITDAETVGEVDHLVIISWDRPGESARHEYRINDKGGMGAI